LAIASKNHNNTLFPWRYYFKTTRLHLLFLTAAISVTFYLFSSQKTDESYKYLFLLLASLLPAYAIFIWFILKYSQSLNVILSKAIQLETLLPIEQKFKTIYAKDEWAKIEVLMNNAEIELKRKVEHIRDEHEKTKILLESILDGIIAIDFFDNVLFSNKTFDTLFNLQQAKLFDNFKIWKLFEDKTIVESFHKCLKGTDALELKAHKLKTIRGELYFDIYFTPISNNHNEIIGVMSIFHDVTELKKIDQMRVDFVANVSHEIRTPLTAIRGFAQMLGQKINQNEAHFLNRIIENSDHMLALFNDLLQLSVLESKERIEKEMVDLPSTFHYLCDSLSHKYQNKKIYSHYQIEADTVLADPHLFEQVITNLIDNAIKYHPKDIIELYLSSQNETAATIIRIKDNGLGMEEKHLSRIFERFYRIDDARTKSNTAGSGIGLSLVKHIMQKHGGKVEVQSQMGMGTEFTLYFPHQHQ